MKSLYLSHTITFYPHCEGAANEYVTIKHIIPSQTMGTMFEQHFKCWLLWFTLMLAMHASPAVRIQQAAEGDLSISAVSIDGVICSLSFLQPADGRSLCAFVSVSNLLHHRTMTLYYIMELSLGLPICKLWRRSGQTLDKSVKCSSAPENQTNTP